MKGHHSSIIEFDGGRAIIDGIPDKCDHNTQLTFYILSNGDVLDERKFRCPTDEATSEYIQKEVERRNAKIVECTSGCSRCGNVHTIKDLMGDAFWI